MIIKYLTVLGLGAAEIWVAVPTGLAMRLGPVHTGILTAIGGILGVLIAILIGEPLRRRVVRRFGLTPTKGRYQRLFNIWQRYGIIGLGLLAPWITGAPLGAVLGVVFGAPARRLFGWLILGLVICTGILVTIGYFGVIGFNRLF
jgi:hypothetical protein